MRALPSPDLGRMARGPVVSRGRHRDPPAAPLLGPGPCPAAHPGACPAAAVQVSRGHRRDRSDAAARPGRRPAEARALHGPPAPAVGPRQGFRAPAGCLPRATDQPGLRPEAPHRRSDPLVVSRRPLSARQIPRLDARRSCDGPVTARTRTRTEARAIAYQPGTPVAAPRSRRTAHRCAGLRSPIPRRRIRQVEFAALARTRDPTRDQRFEREPTCARRQRPAAFR